MRDYVISCSSTADLTVDQMKQYGLEYICFHYELDGKPYPDDLGQTMDFKEFYSAMANGADTKTSQINVEEYSKYFRKFLEEGKDIIHVTLSTGISGTYNSAVIAKNDLEEEFPDRKIYVVDGLGASGGYGLLMITLAQMADKGLSIDELRDWVEKNKLRLHHWFFSTDLTFFVKGGRISKTSGLVGTLLNICPLMNVDFEGRLIPRMKVRTKKKVKQEILAKMIEHAENGKDYSGKCIITQAACYEDAKDVADLVEETFPKLDGKVMINYIGTTIGSHTGPGTVALFFWGDERVD